MIAGIGAAVAISEAIEQASDSEDVPALPTGDKVKFDEKIRGQLGERGWTEDEVRDLTTNEPSGTTTDNTKGRDDPATVYGTKERHVIVNDKNGEVVQVSDTTRNWVPDDRIKWRDDR